MKLHKRVLLVASVLLSAATACKQTSTDSASSQDTLPTIEDTMSKEQKELVDFKFFFTLANLPSPMELINDIYKNEVPFNSDLLNSTDHEEKYTSAYKQSVNYGIYGIDMAYAAFYGQNQDLLSYYSTTKALAEKMNVQETFDRYTESFQKNSDNQDSLVRMIDKAYAETDNYLRNNGRYMTAAHVLAGAIIEVQHLSIALMKDQERTPGNAAIFEKIFNQRMYLDNLVNLFKEFEKDPDSGKLLKDLQELQAAFNAVKSADELTKDRLTSLLVTVDKVRNRMTN